MAKLVDQRPLHQFREAIEDHLKKADTLLSSVEPCAAEVDAINHLVDHRRRLQSANPSTEPEQFARYKEEFDRLTREIEKRSHPWPAVEKARRRFVQDLVTVLNATPVTPPNLREIRKEIERLPLLRDPHVGMKQSEEDLATLQQRLREMLEYLPGGSKQQIVRFPTPAGSSWEDVRIEFLSDHRITVNVLEQSAVFNFAEAGFEDRRTKNPNSSWILLREIAQRNGRLERPRGRREVVRSVEKGVQAIRTTLKELFGMQEDPFHRYQDVQYYRSKFKISFPRSDIR